MRSLTLDSTAGERARWVRAHPEDPERISDPMFTLRRVHAEQPGVHRLSTANRRSHRPGLRREYPLSGRCMPRT